MKAIVLEKFGGVENLVYKDIEIPEITEEEVLVKIRAISINPVDVKVRNRQAPLAESLKETFPLILGWDISGEVIKVGSNIDKFKIGDEVFGMINFVGHGKAYAEYVAAPATHLALKPENITHEQAAASTLAALTAWQAFNSYGKLRAGDKVLIHAASGGVGHFAVQIAKHLGANVTAVTSVENRDFALNLGADQHIDYNKVKFEEVLQDMDFVLEAVGGDNFQKSIKVLKPFGTIVALPSGHTEHDEIKARQKNLHACYFISVYSSGEDMEQIASLLQAGILKPHLSHVYNFNEIAKAHLQIETGRTVGKIVLNHK